jgi:hypothetical protein
MPGSPSESGRAALYMARVNILIIKAAGDRRQGRGPDGRGLPGARALGSIAAG